jgi:hypothetical protein
MLRKELTKPKYTAADSTHQRDDEQSLRDSQALDKYTKDMKEEN